MGLGRVSTGITGLDTTVDMLRLGDNIVWQVESIEEYQRVLKPYVKHSLEEKRKVVYIRFGNGEPVIEQEEGVLLFQVDPSCGFEGFATQIHDIIEAQGKRTFYVFDCLTDLLDVWYSDLMVMNFFKVTCPYLHRLEAVSYFALARNYHTFHTIAGIRETAQVLVDMYTIEGAVYVHPLKVWQRYSPTMFFPHYIHGDEAEPITASTKAAELFSNFNWEGERVDFWHSTIAAAKEKLDAPFEEQEKIKAGLIKRLVGNESRMQELCMKHFKLSDIVKIASREIGTGYIGGKSVGMLLARRVVTREEEHKQYFKQRFEPHDSFYLGADVYYTYVVENGLWNLRTRQKTKEGYFKYATKLGEKLRHGKFPPMIKEEFVHMLEYFGQSPIIVRSSSLLEDNFGNAFAGKYDSVFCVNQGTPEERLENFMEAVRIVYASTMNKDALQYRVNRNLADRDEQMAILIQRVSGDNYGNYFMPHAAGVGNSSNLYVWDSSVDMDAGMLRLVFGLGTRAVDRVIGDYVKIVTLDDPTRIPMVNHGDEQRFSQHKVDVLNLQENCWQTVDILEFKNLDIHTDKKLFWQRDMETERAFRERGRATDKVPPIVNFKKLLEDTEFPIYMKKLLAVLSETYNYPVDVEFTVNFDEQGEFKVNLVQCRPLQTRGLGRTVPIPEKADAKNCLFYSKGNFMGGNVRLPIDYIVFVSVEEYLKLPEQEKYGIARQIGMINQELKGKNALLMGPGRWGTTTPSLGVPVHFTEICHMACICEVSYAEQGLMPELSYGSHFFQDLVESGVFYVALFPEHTEHVVLKKEKIENMENIVESIMGNEPINKEVIHIYDSSGCQLYSDILSQRVVLT
ncbi:MAG: pyruvate kinase [Lachnospiraceae bacterium]|nr:pyruvate kinase [Lachnospiraceae bacterium]